MSWRRVGCRLLAGKMDLQNTTVIVQLIRGASIQLANVVINTKNVGATIQFGGLKFPAATARAAVILVYGMNS
ncbi:hypothetical protein M5K25_005851 [Dendrobium thyrsiflorum]|uniref:Uncharacterized protein n=1 Tax=Dendrobium thyrsiflorum TaxID=117978 RepID=A0ABD0VAU7_DENTH